MTLIYNQLKLLAYIIAAVGAINWGTISAFDLNLVEFIFGNYPLIAKALYAIVGICGLYVLYETIKGIV